MATTSDKFGRVIIPKKIREHLGIHSGTALNISQDGSRIVLESVQEKEPVIDKNGILVFTGKLDAKMSDPVRDDRNKRIKKLLELLPYKIRVLPVQIINSAYNKRIHQTLPRGA